MAEKNMKARIVHKHDTEANWLKATNFTPMKGEIIVYDIDSCKNCIGCYMYYTGFLVGCRIYCKTYTFNVSETVGNQGRANCLY